MGIQPGQQAVTKDNQFVTILGFSETVKSQSDLEQKSKEDLEKVALQTDLKSVNQKIIALFYDPANPERQEVMVLNLFDVIPVIDAKKEELKKMAQMSILNDVEIVKHFINILQVHQNQKNLNEQNKVLVKQLQLHILKSLTHMINVLGQDFLHILVSESLLDDFISFLYQSSQTNTKVKTLIPIDWVELKCSMIKKMALENDFSLVQGSDQFTASVQNNKQLIFKSIDP